MSIRAMTIVFDSNEPPSNKLLLLALTDFGNDDGLSIYPSLNTLAKKTSLSRRHVVRIIAELEERGIVAVDRGQTKKSNQYHVILKKLMGSDTMSPGVVTPCHHSSDTMSPDPLLNHDINQLPLAPQTGARTHKNGHHPFWEESILRLAEIFAKERGCSLPNISRPADFGEAKVRWVKPLEKILSLCEGDEQRASRLIQLSIQHMIVDSLTFSYPLQIRDVAESMNADLSTGKLHDAGLQLTEEEQTARFIASLKRDYA
jgi:hypothetical protein